MLVAGGLWPSVAHGDLASGAALRGCWPAARKPAGWRSPRAWRAWPLRLPTRIPPVRSSRVPEAFSSPLFRMLHTFSMLVPAPGVQGPTPAALVVHQGVGTARFETHGLLLAAAWCRMASGPGGATTHHGTPAPGCAHPPPPATAAPPTVAALPACSVGMWGQGDSTFPQFQASPLQSTLCSTCMPRRSSVVPPDHAA